MACKYQVEMPAVPDASSIGNYIRLDKIQPGVDGRKASSFPTFRVTIENPVGGTYAYRIKSRAVAEKFIECVQAVKPIGLICNA